MLRNYLKMAVRNLWKNKGFSVINIMGLTIGMASSLLILLWVRNELSYDRFHAHADRIYRVTVDAGGFKAAVNPPWMASELQTTMPEIRSVMRVSHPPSVLFSIGTREFEESGVFYADSNFLDFFSYHLVAGDPKTALRRPDAVLLTTAMARKYFGTDGVIGKTLKINNDSLLTVTGILADIPENSHLQFDFILPKVVDPRVDQGLNYSYVRLDDHFDASPATFTCNNTRGNKPSSPATRSICAKRSNESTPWISSNKGSAKRTLLLCRWPIRCQCSRADRAVILG